MCLACEEAAFYQAYQHYLEKVAKAAERNKSTPAKPLSFSAQAVEAKPEGSGAMPVSSLSAAARKASDDKAE